jgi:hypothetical protein
MAGPMTADPSKTSEKVQSDRLSIVAHRHFQNQPSSYQMVTVTTATPSHSPVNAKFPRGHLRQSMATILVTCHSPRLSSIPKKRAKTATLAGLHPGWQAHTRATTPNPIAVTDRGLDTVTRSGLDDADKSQEHLPGPALSSRKVSLPLIIDHYTDILPDEGHHPPACTRPKAGSKETESKGFQQSGPPCRHTATLFAGVCSPPP